MPRHRVADATTELTPDDAALVAASMSQTPEPQRVRPGQRRWLVFGVVSIALFMASVDQTIVATALPQLERDLHARVSWAGWTITVYALGQVLIMPLAGKISDQYGRKKVFVGAVVLFTLTSLCCGLANDVYTLVALRALQAVGGGAFMPSATGIVSDIFGKDRDRAVGLFSSIFPIGGIVGPVLGGAVVSAWSWRLIFLVNVPLGIVLFVCALVVIPHTTRRVQARFDVVGVALMGMTLLAAMLGVTYLGNGQHAPTSVGFVLPILLSLVGGVAFVRHSARASSPFIPIELLRGHGFGVMNLINFLFGAAGVGFGSLVPLYAQSRFSLSTLSAGTMLTFRAVGMIAVAGLAVYFLRRTGYRRPMIIGYITLASGLILMSLQPHGLTPYAWLALTAGISGVGIGMSTPSANNATLQLAPESAAAIAGLRGMFRQAGGITSISIAAAAVARTNNAGQTLSHIFIIFGLVIVATIPLIWLVPEHRGNW